ncbi:MAG: 16S rRNA (cytosine(1402)-N(4))-methyltransferase RsmH [Clostridia bacterium]|nr:16S rRNA (cytosine(1402)-N(4))-methyltransferase RsmH [Clostridia bacterium]
MSGFTHIPVLLNEVMTLLAPKPGHIVVDGTVGLGGHSEKILERIGAAGKLYGIDRDTNALEMSKKRLKDRFTPIHGNFFDMRELLTQNNVDLVDGILLDLGVSSYQLDDGSRGFSFHEDAPLDMRMDREQPYSAKDAVNELSEKRLTEIIRDYGEERWAARIASFIVQRRKTAPIETTSELVDVIKAAVPKGARRDGPHPARRTFQALRIHVNDELDKLGQALEQAAGCLKPGGVLCVITFHSLEDRIVKQTFAKLEHPCTCPPHTPVCICGKEPVAAVLTRKPIAPTELECEENPRARSAKVRAVRKYPF